MYISIIRILASKLIPDPVREHTSILDWIEVKDKYRETERKGKT